MNTRIYRKIYMNHWFLIISKPIQQLFNKTLSQSSPTYSAFTEGSLNNPCPLSRTPFDNYYFRSWQHCPDNGAPRASCLLSRAITRQCLEANLNSERNNGFLSPCLLASVSKFVFFGLNGLDCRLYSQCFF